MSALAAASSTMFDLIVIGCGSGGVRAARIAAKHGAKVAVVDDLKVGLGGTCVNVGCVPKKLYVYGSEYGPRSLKSAEGFGWKHPVGATHDWNVLKTNKDKEIGRLNGIYERLCDGAGATVMKGFASFVDPHTIKVDHHDADLRYPGETKLYTAAKILIAVGGWPVTLKHIPGHEHMITSNECFWDIEKTPKRVVVIGGGYIAVEFAGIFHGYGADVHVVIRKDRILRGFDQDVRSFLQQEMVKKGIHVHTNANVSSVVAASDSRQVTLDTGDVLDDVDVVLCAAGRRPKLAGLNLDKAGVELSDTGAIKTNEWSRTSVEHIYAVGDVTDTLQLTPVALRQGHAFADTHFGSKTWKADTSNTATAVFSRPNVGTCGMTEDEAAKHHDVVIYTSDFRPLKGTISGDEERTFMKLIVDEGTGKVLGMHYVGPHAGELMQGFAVAIKCGATKADFDATIGIHPTSAEEFVTMRTPKYKRAAGSTARSQL